MNLNFVKLPMTACLFRLLIACALLLLSACTVGPDYVLPTTAIPCLLYTSPSPRDRTRSRMPSSA